jgi:hypothetical protein
MNPGHSGILSANGNENNASLAGRLTADVAAIILGTENIANGAAIASVGSAVACGTTLCIGSVATVAVGVGVAAVGAGQVSQGAIGLGENLSLFSEDSSNFSNQSQLSSHFKKHGSEFGFISEDEYLAGAQKFVSTEGNEGVLTKVRNNGDRIIYNPITNEFAVVSDNGVIRTYFKPDPLSHGYETNYDYYNAQ